MQWAFWRSSRRSKRAEDLPLPDAVGLIAQPSIPAAAADRDEPAERTASSPFSGASPDAAKARVRGEPTWAGESGAPAVLDPATAAQDAGAVAVAVRSLLAGDAAALDAALSPLQDQSTRQRAAGALAAQALAARLPALSGVTGEVVFDEPADELLHAYADLLAERAEPLRRVASAHRDEISAVAHLAAAAAEQDSAADRAHRPAADQPVADRAVGTTRGALRLALPDVAARQQLLAACVLLAQTCRDGGGDAAALAAELAALAGETPG